MLHASTVIAGAWGVLQHRPRWVVFVVVLVGHRATSTSMVPKGFIPGQDNDQIHFNIEALARHLVLSDGSVLSGRSRK